MQVLPPGASSSLQGSEAPCPAPVKSSLSPGTRALSCLEDPKGHLLQLLVTHLRSLRPRGPELQVAKHVRQGWGSSFLPGGPGCGLFFSLPSFKHRLVPGRVINTGTLPFLLLFCLAPTPPLFPHLPEQGVSRVRMLSEASRHPFGPTPFQDMNASPHRLLGGTQPFSRPQLCTPTPSSGSRPHGLWLDDQGP